MIRHDPFRIPPEEIARRLEGLRATMSREDLALVWLEHLTDRLYFAGSIQDGVLLVPRDGRPVFVVRKSAARAAAESPHEVRPFAGRKSLLAAARELGMNLAGARLGLAMEVTSAATERWLARELAYGEAGDVGPAIRRLRMVKSPWEIACVRRASEQASAVFRELGAELAPGMLELEATAWAEARLRARGHAGAVRVRRSTADVAMISLVGGASALYPTAFDGCVGGEGPSPFAPAGAGWRRFAAGETVMADMVTHHAGYQADNARAWSLGAPPAAAAAAHAFCLETLERLEEALKPGAVCGDIYREIKRWTESRGEPEGFMGYGDNRVRFFGHGVGLELDEWPVLAERFEEPLAPGMVIAVEPKAFLPGIGPVGLENTYFITDRGCESTCDAPRELLRHVERVLPAASIDGPHA